MCQGGGTMATINDLAQVLISAWVLGGGAPDEELPSSDGILDAALRDVVVAGAFPDWFQQKLRLTETPFGVECLELGAVLDEAQASRLTSAPNPSYTRTEVMATSFMARSMLFDLGVDEDAAREWGGKLHGAVERQMQ